jgi:hypothetical protein
LLAGIVCALEDRVDLIVQLHELIGVFFRRGLLAEVPPTFFGYGHTPPQIVAGDAHYTPLLFGGVKAVEAQAERPLAKAGGPWHNPGMGNKDKKSRETKKPKKKQPTAHELKMASRPIFTTPK